MITAIVDHKIRLPMEGLSEDVLWELHDALTLENAEKREAKERKQYGWGDMPDTIDLWEVDGDDLLIPRGFATLLIDGMAENGIDIEFDDRRTYKAAFRVGKKIKLFEDQEPIVELMREHEQGIVKAPTGAGKTVKALAFLRSIATKSIVVVNTKEIAQQWIDRVHEYLGDDYPVGLVGDGSFEVSPYLTIALQPTLHRRFEKLEADGFFDQFGSVILDECHHVTASSYRRVFDRFSARYRIGLSATPDKTGDFKIAEYTIGPVFARVKESDLIESGRLIKPVIVRVATTFQFGVLGSSVSRKRWHALTEALSGNEDRNTIIARAIVKNDAGHCVLVLSDRLEQLGVVESLLEEEGWKGDIYWLSGRQNREERKRVYELADAGDCVILSTLAKEATDIPRIDRVHMIWPHKNPGLIAQKIGRGKRKHADKGETRIYDYVDGKVGPLDAQWKKRLTNVYMPQGLEIRKLKGRELLDQG